MKTIFVLLNILFIIEGSHTPYCFQQYKRNTENINTCSVESDNYRASISCTSRKCKMNDKNLSTCLAQKATEEWPEFVKTYKLNKIQVNAEKTVANFAKGTLAGFFFGYEDVKFNDIFVDFNNRAVDIIYSQPTMSMFGNYTLNGRFLGIGLDEFGISNITYTNGLYNYHFDYDIEQRDGEEYIQLTTFRLSFNAKEMFINFTSNDNPERGEYITSLFNCNWRVLNIIVENAVSEVMSEVYSPILREYFNKTPLKSLFA